MLTLEDNPTVVGRFTVGMGSNILFDGEGTNSLGSGCTLESLLREQLAGSLFLEPNRLTLSEGLKFAREDFQRFGWQLSPALFPSRKCPGSYVKAVTPCYPENWHFHTRYLRFDIPGSLIEPTKLACGVALVAWLEEDGQRKVSYFTGEEVDRTYKELIVVSPK